MKHAYWKLILEKNVPLRVRPESNNPLRSISTQRLLREEVREMLSERFTTERALRRSKKEGGIETMVSEGRSEEKKRRVEDGLTFRVEML